MFGVHTYEYDQLFRDRYLLVHKHYFLLDCWLFCLSFDGDSKIKEQGDEYDRFPIAVSHFYQGDVIKRLKVHCFICRPSESTVLKDAGIEPRRVATTALAVRRSNHSHRGMGG